MAPRRLSMRKKTVFAIAATLLFLLIIELTLRVIGFRFQTRAPNLVVNGQNVAPMFRYSKSFNWEPIPGAGPFNEDGFIGPRLSVERTPGTPRIATLGDSCTQFGEPSYPTVLRERLSDRLGHPLEVLNAGVVGYSTEQGWPRLEGKVLPHRPDIVTLYFGWNDHWMMNKLTDAEIAVEDAQSWRWLDTIGWSRVVQAGLCCALTVHEKRAWEIFQQAQVVRVPLDRYRDNLRRMIELAGKISAEPILVTAPSDTTPETAAKEFTNLITMQDSGYETPKAMHDAYVEATREVARETDVRLVDAAAAFDGRKGLIMRDHIHLTADGITELAEMLAEAILSLDSVNLRLSDTRLP